MKKKDFKVNEKKWKWGKFYGNLYFVDEFNTNFHLKLLKMRLKLKILSNSKNSIKSALVWNFFHFARKKNEEEEEMWSKKKYKEEKIEL